MELAIASLQLEKLAIFWPTARFAATQLPRKEQL